MEKDPSSTRIDRKTLEKNRRNYMRSLYSQLNSLVPHQTPKELLSLPDQLHEAKCYIERLQSNVERTKEKRNGLLGLEKRKSSSSSRGCGGIGSPQIEIREMESALEVILVTGLDSQFLFNEAIRILHEEGTEVVNASFSVVDDAVLHTIHAKIGEPSLSGGARRISQRLKSFFQY